MKPTIEMGNVRRRWAAAISTSALIAFLCLLPGCAFWKTTTFTDDRDHPVFVVAEHSAGLLIGPCNPYIGAQKDETRFILNGHKPHYDSPDIDMMFGDRHEVFVGSISVDWRKREITISPSDPNNSVCGTYRY